MKKSFIALALLLPSPSIGVFSAMVLFPNSGLGAAIFFACKVWMFALPLAWHFLVARQDVGTLKLSARGLGIGTALGLAICAFIAVAYVAAGKLLLDGGLIQDQLTKVGFTAPIRYIGLALYWTLVNSLIEEYVWRWFVTQQFQRIVRPWLAVVLSGIGFTLHHIVAMHVYFGPAALAIASFGIFIGGVTWSGLYIRYRSIWPGYVSHALVDAIVFAIGYTLVFP